MSTHSNFQWAFKHIMPYFNQYPNAVQELNKCVQLFIHQEYVKPSGSTAGKVRKKRVSTAAGDRTMLTEAEHELKTAKCRHKENIKSDANDIDEPPANDDDEDEEDEEDEDEDDEEANQLQQIILNFKETLATSFLMNTEIEIKQSWQSIIMVMYL